MLQLIRDGVDVEVYQVIPLDFGLGSSRVGPPAGSPCVPHQGELSSTALGRKLRFSFSQG